GRGRGRDGRDCLLPRWRVRLRIVVAGWPIAGQPRPAHRVLRHQQVEDRCDDASADSLGGYAALDHPATLGIADVKARKTERHRIVMVAVDAQHWIDAVEVQVPFADTRFREAARERATR